MQCQDAQQNSILTFFGHITHITVQSVAHHQLCCFSMLIQWSYLFFSVYKMMLKESPAKQHNVNIMFCIRVQKISHKGTTPGKNCMCRVMHWYVRACGRHVEDLFWRSFQIKMNFHHITENRTMTLFQLWADTRIISLIYTAIAIVAFPSLSLPHTHTYTLNKCYEVLFSLALDRALNYVQHTLRFPALVRILRW